MRWRQDARENGTPHRFRNLRGLATSSQLMPARLLRQHLLILEIPSVLYRRTRRQRILPPETRESREITVRGTEGQPVFDGERRQVRIGDETARHPRRLQQSPQYRGMLRPWQRRPRRLAPKPFFDLLPGVGHTRGIAHDDRIGRQTDERQQRRPRESDSSRPIEAIVEPGTRAIVSAPRRWRCT